MISVSETDRPDDPNTQIEAAMATRSRKATQVSNPTEDEFDEVMKLHEKLFLKKEKIAPELEKYLDHGVSDLPMLRHPLLHQLMVVVERAALTNYIFFRKKDAASKALAEKRWSDYVYLHETPYWIGEFAKIESKLPDDEYWASLGDIYIHTENVWHYKRQLTKLFLADRPNRDRLMTAAERRVLAGLPSRLTIYRGSQSKGMKGWSWTLDERKARWFANRWAMLDYGKPYLAIGTARKSDVIAYFSRRKEKEVVIDPTKVKIKSVEKLPKQEAS